ncbi:hypothetical protein PVAND_011625 [Polypedilum vanderplanki]|uniref:C3H1-type domain-containing protein n=1 Tax=Polypedilum vanderplanki TaxID=319348 RepID=A0A9J6CJX0_POLVA|nr:hypothetical protein PVAND_011625 [Polypedilum vanderplanki]
MTEKSSKINKISSISKEVDQHDEEDSSYDSDTEVSTTHQNVSRNVSETLKDEFEDYNNSTSYRQYLEFSLKLGYSERLVQQALKRLVNPTNNELLAELIKLGTTTIPGSNACDYGDIKNEIGDENAIAVNEHIQQDYSSCLRPIVIDGSNVAMGHGNKEIFSCRGIGICVDWFKQRGHKDITVFVPKWRKESARPDNPIKDQEILNELEKERILVYTPSRSLTNGKRMVCYDDRYILKLASENDGIVVSNDNYRDLLQESSEFKKVVEERILMYSFVNDRFMPPDDPMGKMGPTLDNFLKFQPKKIDTQICPYGAKKKCTYGNKCKFFHPERGSIPHKSVAEKLSDFYKTNSEATKKQQIQGKSLSVPIANNSNSVNFSSTSGSGENFNVRKQTLCRTTSNLPMQQQQQQYRLSPGQQPLSASASTSPTNNMNMPHMQKQQQHFPKSHSIDNLPLYQQKPVNYSNNNLWNPQNTTQQQQSDLPTNSQTPQQQSPQPPQQSSIDNADMSLNLHKKLQRQLSLLNPYDPRLYPMQQRFLPPPPPPPLSSGNTNPDLFLTSSSPAHKQLTASHSLTLGNAAQAHSIYEHQNVFRIASAPNSSNINWANTSHQQHPSTSASEPQINYSIYEQRRRLHYHLCNIFPCAIVEEVMSHLSDETNPQTICAAILNIQNLRQK